MPESSPQQPLAGLKVLDLSRLLPGPFCSLLLADLGADVLKVEDTGMGDYARWVPPYLGDESQQKRGVASAQFNALNRNKQSVRLNLKDAAGREILLKLVARHDVVLESFRPGVLDKLGVGYETMKATNPGLIYCAITGYGQDGPLRDRAGHDMNYLGLGGLLALSRATDGPPVQAAGQIADVGGGAQMAAVAILAALVRRNATGKGGMIDISMTDGAISWLAMPAARALAGERPLRRGSVELAGAWLCYMPYEAADGWVSCGALEPKFWRAFCEGAGREDLIDKQFESAGSPAWQAVAAVFKSKTRAEWAAFNAERDCCIEPVLEIEEALDSELVRQRGMIATVQQPGIGPVRQLASPFKFDGERPGRAEPAPAFGEHTDAVLRTLGYDDDEIARLREAGTVMGP
ncbi:MAG: CoA transferase [Thermoleophilia bacterium]|nr:CoA transferase [Thermoleophilia bacterium]